MISHLSLRTTLLVVFILISGILIPYTVFASPIFETDSVKVGTGGSTEFTFEPEQSWSWPDNDSPFGGKISSTDVAVFEGETLQEVYVLFVEYTADPKKIYLAYTSNVTQHPNTGSPYFTNFVNNTSTAKLNEFIPTGGSNFCNTPNIAPNILPQVAVTTSHVFVSWLDIIDGVPGACDASANEGYAIATIAIAKSSFDDLTTTAFFNPTTTTPAFFNTDNGGATESSPTSYTLTANGTNAFIVWENATDSTVNFIPFNGTKYVAGADTGVGFGTNIILGTSTSKDPDVLVESSTPYDIHVAWQDEDTGDKNIKLATSADGGLTFGAETDISGTNSVTSANARLAEDGGTVYVSWLEGTSATRQVFVASSGNTFTPVAVSTNEGISSDQQIITGGTNVFVVWEDTIDNSTSASTDVLFSNSTDSGVTFADPVNLSTSTGKSINPKISGNSTHVNVVWNDNTFAPENLGTNVDGEVWLKSYSVPGNFLGGLQVISESTVDGTGKVYNAQENQGPAPVPNISSTDDIIVAVWSPDPARTELLDFANPNMWDGSMKTAIPSAVDISFNGTEYLSPRNATITVVDASKAGSGSVLIDVNNLGTSTLFADRTLIETGPSTGIFTDTVEFSNSTFSGLTGHVFTANYTTASGSIITTQAKIQETRILDFVPTGSVLHDIGAKVGLRLTDADSNLNAGTAETIKVKIKSDVDNNGFKITLTETGVDTGVFEALSSVVFMDGTLTPSVGDSLTITKTQNAGDPLLVETLNQKITTTTTPGGVTLTLTETGVDTNSFTANISICASSDPLCISPNISGVGGDFITISNTGGTQVSNGIIIPNSLVTRGAIEVFCNGSDCGQVRAIYNDLEVPFNVGVTTAGGGGGGGVSRAGLVVNALAGLSSASLSVVGGGGGGTDGSSPITSLGTLVTNKNFDIPDEVAKIVENYDPKVPLKSIPSNKFKDFDLPLTINENGYPLAGYSNTIDTFSTTIGDPITLTSLYYEQTAIQHVSMYLNLRGIISGDLSQSDTQILYNKDKPLQIIDPNGYFESVTVNIIEDEESIKKFAEFEIVFAKYLEKSDIVLRSWDDKLRSSDTIIYDAIEVIDFEKIVDESLDFESDEIIEEVDNNLTKVPEWVKNNAEWWSQGEVDDTTFKNAIGFLIDKQIIDMPTGPNVSVSTEGLSVDEIRALEEEAQRVTPIPDWIKSTAEWWYLGDVTEDEFLMSIEYLVKNRIIEI